jgi:hypothetical protein
LFLRLGFHSEDNGEYYTNGLHDIFDAVDGNVLHSLAAICNTRCGRCGGVGRRGSRKYGASWRR